MQRFKSILAVLTEDSLAEVAFARAILLAKRNDAALTLVDVIDAAPGELGRLMATLTGSDANAIEDDVVAYHRDRVAGFAERARAEGITVSEAVLQGSGFVEVIRMVLREGHDIVIKGATDAGHGKGMLKGFDMHLLRKCPCPVWMLMSTDKATSGAFRKILATVDPEPTGDMERDNLDRLVLDLATSKAERDGGTCEVIHSWHLHEEQALRHSRYSRAYTGEVDTLVEREEEAARVRLAALLADYPQIDKSHVHLRKGQPGDVIADFAEAEGTELIVMGTVGRTGLSGFIMGNTAETILSRVRCSVIAVKPAGFKSPVTLDSDG